MTETPGDRSAEPTEPTEPASAPADAGPSAARPPAPPAPAAPSGPYAQAPYPQPSYAQPAYAQPAYGPSPFAPVARAPREPWINPAKRVAVLLTSIVAALVLLFVGAVIGHAATRHHEQRVGNERGNVYQNGPYGPNRGQLPGVPPRNRQGPGSAPTAKSTPTPTPSTTS